MRTIKQLTQSALAEIEKNLPNKIFNDDSQADRSINDFISTVDVEVKGNRIRDRKTGLAIPSLTEALHEHLISKGYIKRKNDNFVAAWEPVKPGQFSPIMESLITRALQYEHIHFKSDQVQQEVIKTLSENFLAFDGANGVEYKKINSIGLVSDKSFSLSDILRETGVNQFLDSDKSQIAKGIHESKLRTTAEQIDSKRVPEVMEQLRKVELRGLNPGRVAPKITNVRSEFERLAKANYGKNAALFTLNDIRAIEREIDGQVNALNDLTEVATKISAIQPPTAQTYEGLSYE